MPSIAGSGDADESGGKKKNFIGQVEFANVDCTCEHCQEGDEKADDDWESDLDHILVEPLTEYDSDGFSIFSLNSRSSFGSKWMMFVGHIDNIHGGIVGEDKEVSTIEELCEFLEGRVYEWRELDFTEDEDFTWEYAGDGGVTKNIGQMFSNMTNPPNNMIFPVREITDDAELADLGVSPDAGDVDDVEL